MGNEIGIGVIGAGYWGKKHIDELSKIPGVTLSVSDLLAENLEHCRQKHKEVRLEPDYRRLLSDPSVKGVTICVRNDAHYVIAKEALLADKHVLVEKPLADSVSASYELVEIAKKHGKILCVGHLFRFNAAVVRLRELCRSGFFGKIYFMKIQWTNHSPMHPERDVNMDLGTHTFDIINFITGQWPEKSECFGEPYRRERLDEVSYIRSFFPNGMRAYTELSWLLPDKKREVFVVGENGAAKADCDAQKAWSYSLKDYGYVQEELEVNPSNALGEELSSFVDDCRCGKIIRSDNTGEAGARTVEALAACKRI